MEIEMERNSEPNRNRSIFIAWERDGSPIFARDFRRTARKISFLSGESQRNRRGHKATRCRNDVTLVPRKRNLDSDDDDPRWCQTMIADSSSRSRNEHGNPCHRLLSFDIQPRPRAADAVTDGRMSCGRVVGARALDPVRKTFGSTTSSMWVPAEVTRRVVSGELRHARAPGK